MSQGAPQMNSSSSKLDACPDVIKQSRAAAQEANRHPSRPGSAVHSSLAPTPAPTLAPTSAKVDQESQPISEPAVKPPDLPVAPTTSPNELDPNPVIPTSPEIPLAAEPNPSPIQGKAVNPMPAETVEPIANPLTKEEILNRAWDEKRRREQEYANAKNAPDTRPFFEELIKSSTLPPNVLSMVEKEILPYWNKKVECAESLEARIMHKIVAHCLLQLELIARDTASEIAYTRAQAIDYQMRSKLQNIYLRFAGELRKTIDQIRRIASEVATPPKQGADSRE